MAANYVAVKAEAKRYADGVRSKLPVDRLFLFGSYAKGTTDKRRDADIAFFFRDYGSRIRTERDNLVNQMTKLYIIQYFLRVLVK